MKHKKLSWLILEYKLAYYRPDLVDPLLLPKLTISDREYDDLENIYIKTCLEEGVSPNARLMVGFDLNRPCCQLVLSKWGKL